MNRLSRCALSLLAASILTAVILEVNAIPLASQPGSAPVTVVNTPLPVTGSIAIGSSTTLPVTISGTPDVQVTNLPTRTPYHFRLTANYGEDSAGTTPSHTVPAGKIFEMQHVACRGGAPGESDGAMSVLLLSGDSPNRAEVVALQVPQPGPGNRDWYVTQETHVFIGPVSNHVFSSTVTLSVHFNQPGDIECYIAGELLN